MSKTINKKENENKNKNTNPGTQVPWETDRKQTNLPLYDLKPITLLIRLSPEEITSPPSPPNISRNANNQNSLPPAHQGLTTTLWDRLFISALLMLPQKLQKFRNSQQKNPHKYVSSKSEKLLRDLESWAFGASGLGDGTTSVKAGRSPCGHSPGGSCSRTFHRLSHFIFTKDLQSSVINLIVQTR